MQLMNSNKQGRAFDPGRIDRRQEMIIGLVIVFLMGVSLFAFDLYLPSLPDIVRELHVDETSVQLTISSYFFGLAFSQLLYGPLSDRYGRKSLLLLGAVVCCIGTTMCLFSFSIAGLLLGRLVQGFGAGSYYSLCRTIMRDIFTGEELSRFSSYVSAALAIAPAIAPLIGGYLHANFGWRSNFLFLLILFILCGIFVWRFLPETGRFFHALPLCKAFRNYGVFLKNRVFMNYVLCSCLAYSGIAAYFTVAPFLFQNRFQLSTIQFSWLSLCTMIGLGLGSLLNARLVMRRSLNTMIKIGGNIMVVAGVCMGIFGLCNVEQPLLIIVPSILFLMACSIIFANASAGALSQISESIGAACALFGFIQILGPALTSAVVAAMFPCYLGVLAAIYLFVGLSSLFCASLRQNQR